MFLKIYHTNKYIKQKMINALKSCLPLNEVYICAVKRKYMMTTRIYIVDVRATHLTYIAHIVYNTHNTVCIQSVNSSNIKLISKRRFIYSW